MFHFHSLLIYFSIYIVTSKGFSQFCNSHAYSIPLAYAGSMFYAIPSFLNIYTIDAHSIHFQFCSLIAFPSLLMVSHCIVFLFCIYNFRKKSQFHIKWICQNKFIIIIIILLLSLLLLCCKTDEFL